MVDQLISTTGWIFLLDFGIFIFYVLVFFAIRTTRGDKVLLPNWNAERELTNARFTARDLRPSVAAEIEFNEQRSIDMLRQSNDFLNISLVAAEDTPQVKMLPQFQPEILTELQVEKSLNKESTEQVLNALD